MAQNKYALARYQLIHRSLRRNAYVKTLYLTELCKQILDYNVSQRTIQMDIEAMKNDPFLGYFAPIEYCKKRKAYYYLYCEYELTPHSFSNHEINVLHRICENIGDAISGDDFHVFITIVKKITIIAAYEPMAK